MPQDGDAFGRVEARSDAPVEDPNQTGRGGKQPIHRRLDLAAARDQPIALVPFALGLGCVCCTRFARRHLAVGIRVAHAHSPITKNPARYQAYKRSISSSASSSLNRRCPVSANTRKRAAALRGIGSHSPLIYTALPK